MNSKDSVIKDNSIFSFSDIENYTKNCNSEKDCPGSSSCIGNKCIFTFYCKIDDKSVCSFYNTLCDGKPCYKENEEINIEKCTDNKDCLSDICENGICDRTDVYASDFFSYENAKNYFMNLNKCKSDKDCPSQATCLEKECTASFYCKENDNNICSFYERIKDKKPYQLGRKCQTNDNCLSGVCSNNICSRNNYALISRTTQLFGLEEGENCTTHQQCHTKNCRDGQCGKIQELNWIIYVVYGLFALGIALETYNKINKKKEIRNNRNKNQ